MLNYHELITDVAKKLTCIDVEINIDSNLSKTMTIGYIYLENIESDRIELIAENGDKYEILIPEECRNIEGSQFNVTLQILREYD